MGKLRGQGQGRSPHRGRGQGRSRGVLKLEWSWVGCSAAWRLVMQTLRSALLEPRDGILVSRSLNFPEGPGSVLRPHNTVRPMFYPQGTLGLVDSEIQAVPSMVWSKTEGSTKDGLGNGC